MNAEREESLAWDRFGRFLQQSGTKSSEIADRNVRLWSSVSGHLKKNQYTADDMADDIARSISTAVDNMSTVWSMFTNDSAQNALAQPIPTAFLLFDWAGTSRHRLLEPVRIEVGSLPGRSTLPQWARVELNGSRGPLSDEEKRAGQRGVAIANSQDGVQRLRERIVAYRDDNSRTYILADVSRILETPTTDKVDAGTPGVGVKSDSWFIEKALVPGVYDGIVYLTDPPALLASVRIVVEGAPPAPPIVSEESAQASPETKTI
jgi:hypothetical protein